MPKKDRKVYVEFEMSPDDLPFDIEETLYFHEGDEFTACIDWKKNTMIVEVVLTPEDANEFGWSSLFEERVIFMDDYDDPNGGDSEDDEVEED